jgi:hypothetical protein
MTSSLLKAARKAVARKAAKRKHPVLDDFDRVDQLLADQKLVNPKSEEYKKLQDQIDVICALKIQKIPPVYARQKWRTKKIGAHLRALNKRSKPKK